MTDGSPSLNRPTLVATRNSSAGLIRNPEETRIKAPRQLYFQASITGPSESLTQVLPQVLVRGLEYVFASCAALLCSYWILQGRW